MKKFNINTYVCFCLVILLIVFAIPIFGNKEQTQPLYSKTEYDTYTLHSNLAYAQGERQVMDLCLPNTTGTINLVLMIHGGGWIAGDKSAYLNEIKHWCQDNGYVSASINYTYATGEISAEDILNDITLSLQKIKEVAKNYGINVNKVLLTGASAGAHLSLLYAYSKANIAPITPVAVVSLCGPTDLTDTNYFAYDTYKDMMLDIIPKISGYNVTLDNFTTTAVPFLMQASPINYVSAKSVPTIICHGTKDDVVPYSNAQTLKNKLDEYGVTNNLITFPNSGHGLESDPESTLQANTLMLEYANTYLK